MPVVLEFYEYTAIPNKSYHNIYEGIFICKITNLDLNIVYNKIANYKFICIVINTS